MPTIKVNGEPLEVTNEQFKEIRNSVHQHKSEYKELDAVDVAIQVGNVLIGYAIGRTIDRIIKEVKK